MLSPKRDLLSRVFRFKNLNFSQKICHPAGKKGEKLKNRIQKATVLSIFFAVSLFSMPINAPAEAKTVNQLNKEINTTTKKLNAKQAKVRSLESQVATLNAQIKRLYAQIRKTQAEIKQTNRQITALNAQIRQNEAELQVQKKILNEHLKTLYEEGGTSTVEIIASSGNFSDFIDRAEYLQVMQMKVRETVDKIKSIRKELDKKRKGLNQKKEKLNEAKKRQALQKKAVKNQRAYKKKLLKYAKSQAKAAKNKLNNLYAQKAALSAQYSEGVIRGGSSYPYGSPPAGNIIDTPDPWGYLIGECTSYAAWKRASMGRPVPRGLGNANTWTSAANSSSPSVGAVAVFPYLGYYGHVAIVDAVYSNGSILISEYNWIPYSYSRRVINPYNYGIVYIR